jgi:two-component system sensor histidine kinase EvgS
VDAGEDARLFGAFEEGETPPPATLAELEGKRIVLQRGDIMHDFAVENGLEREITAVDAQEDALRELAEGKHDVALVSRLTAFYWIEKYG